MIEKPKNMFVRLKKSINKHDHKNLDQIIDVI